MNYQETFILTLLCDPQRSAEPRGRLRHVVSNKEVTFKNLEELANWLREFASHGHAWQDDQPSQKRVNHEVPEV